MVIAQAFHDVLDELGLIIIVVYGEAPVDIFVLTVFPQYAHAYGMKGAGPYMSGSFPQISDKTAEDLSCGLFGERDSQYVVGLGFLLADNISDTGSQDTGLAGTGARKHQHRALGVSDGLVLPLVQLVKRYVVHTLTSHKKSDR